MTFAISVTRVASINVDTPPLFIILLPSRVICHFGIILKLWYNAKMAGIIGGGVCPYIAHSGGNTGLLYFLVLNYFRSCGRVDY